MVIGPTEELGRTLASVANNQADTADNAMFDESAPNIQLVPIEAAQVQTTVYIYKKNYSTTSFVIDHPVYGDIDSSTLEIDGDYSTGGNQFPLDFPINWDEVEGSSLVSSYTS